MARTKAEEKEEKEEEAPVIARINVAVRENSTEVEIEGKWEFVTAKVVQRVLRAINRQRMILRKKVLYADRKEERTAIFNKEIGEEKEDA